MAGALRSMNPFATRAVRPGSIPFHFPPGTGLPQLLQQLENHAWWGEITGPHGSGKTTLLESLAVALEQAGRTPARFTLHQRQRSLPETAGAWRRWDRDTQVIIDGYEQLSWLNRWRVKRRCRRRGCGLLVTAHQPTGLPPLFHTQVTPELARRLVHELLPQDCRVIQREDVDRCLDHQAGNMREAFFELYDLYESRNRKSGA